MAIENFTKNRLDFLKRKYNVIDFNHQLEPLLSEKSSDEYCIISNNDIIYGVSLNKTIYINDTVFNEMVSSDPTNNKQYLQWLLNIFVQGIKKSLTSKDFNEEIKETIRFISEDLPQASKYLIIFDDNKRKKRFKEIASKSYSLLGIKDVTNINQYKSLSQLFDAVFPFIERDYSLLEKQLHKMVEINEGIIHVMDTKFTLFQPLTLTASELFDSFTNWCTSRPKNGMFKSYTEKHRLPNGSKSKLYIIINNEVFSGKSKKLWQLHVETEQLRNENDTQDLKNFVENVYKQSEGIRNFLYYELLGNAKKTTSVIFENKYLSYLIRFGEIQALLDILNENEKIVKIINQDILKDISLDRFNQLEWLILINNKLEEITFSFKNLTKLKSLVIADNNLTKIPKNIGSLKNLEFINLTGNKINKLPEEIKYLDPNNGGSLKMICVDNTIEIEGLKSLLPNVKILNNI